MSEYEENQPSREELGDDDDMQETQSEVSVQIPTGRATQKRLVKKGKYDVSDESSKKMYKDLRSMKKRCRAAETDLHMVQCQYEGVLAEMKELKEMLAKNGITFNKQAPSQADVHAQALLAKNQFHALSDEEEDVVDMDEGSVETVVAPQGNPKRKPLTQKPEVRTIKRLKQHEQPEQEHATGAVSDVGGSAQGTAVQVAIPSVPEQGAKTVQAPAVKKVPIRVTKYNGVQLSNALIEKGLHLDFKPATKGPGMSVLVDIEQKEEVMKILKEQDARGHSYLTDNERREVIVLKGINYTWTAEMVAEEIQHQLNDMTGPINTFDVNRLKTYWSEKNGNILDHLIVRAEDKDTMNAIKSIKVLCHTHVTWEKMKRPAISMCGHCLETGHTKSGGCLNDWRCKACGGTAKSMEEHECKVCKVPPKDEMGRDQNIYKLYFCFRCQEHGHPGSYTKCINFKKDVKRAEDAKEKKAMERAEKRGYAAPVSYTPASAPKTNAWTQRKEYQERKKEPPRMNDARPIDMDEEMRRLFGKNANKLQELAEKFAEEYKFLTTESQRMNAFAKYYLNVAQWR